jgi:hypothetical protein
VAATSDADPEVPPTAGSGATAEATPGEA